MNNKGKTNGEIIVFTAGDSSKIKTWSNVPYFFTTTLEEKGFKVHRINIESGIFMFVGKAINKILKTCGIIERYGIIGFDRLKIYQLCVNKKMKKAVKKYPKSKLLITMNFSNSGSSVSKIPSLLFCDWTIEYYIKNRLNREPKGLELRAINRQDEEIEKSNYVVSLFPDVTEYMNKYYSNQIYYLGNVINSKIKKLNMDNITKNRRSKKKFLFIGRKAYISSAIKLLEAVHLINKQRNEKYKVIIIGINENDIPEKFKNYIAYGYLDKGNLFQEKKYYNEIYESIAIVNTTEKWAGASSIIEAMFYGTPVITAKYDAFVKTFGEKINFGYYSNNNVQDIEKIIMKLIDMDEDSYERMCNNAHNSVKDYTWSSYIDKIIKLTKL